MTLRYLTVAEAMALHQLLMRDQGQVSRLIDAGKLESALQRPQAEAFGEEFYETIWEKGAALLEGIIAAHAFLDGNKRLGLVCLATFLRLNGVRWHADHEALFLLVMEIAAGDLRDIDEIAARIRDLFALD
jgi:death-on-curing protein